jgi:glycosyltransferase involved in cell wall biosynthesis
MISFIIPAYQEEKFIERTLLNIPNNFEKIVVCNNCSDQTYNIAKKYAKVINISEKNVSKARNLGGKSAKNDFLVFLDADTRLVKNALKELINLKNRNIVGTFKTKFNKNNFSLSLYSFIKNIFPLFRIHNASGTIFCNKKVFEKVNGFDENLIRAENQDFIKRCKRYSDFYFSRNYSITSSRRFEKIGFVKDFFYWLKGYFGKKEYINVR